MPKVRLKQLATDGATDKDSLQHNGSSWAVLKNTHTTSDPTANDDGTQGYSIGSRWINTTGDKEWVCLDTTTATAVWTETTGSSGGDSISVNGVSANDADFDDTTPTVPADGVNVRWQKDTATPNNISANAPVAAPGSTSVATASAAGSASTVARSDHVHQSNTAPADVTKNTAAIGTSGEPARADHKHDVTTAAPASTGVATASSEGAATTLARSDHAHQSNTAPADTTKAAAAIGTSGEPARADHKHDVSTAAPAAAGVGTTSGEGSATSLARSDHSHQSNTAPADVTKAAAAIGTSTEPARADHKHDVSTAAATSVGTANAEGSATSLARSDHTHQVTGLAIASEAQGDILYRNATVWVRLPAGNSGEVLQTQGAAANPQWGEALGATIFPPSATDPAGGAAGDQYYNTAINRQMFYDSSRTKWLSMDVETLEFGRNSVTGANSYYRGLDGRAYSATAGKTAKVAGTVVGIEYTRSDTDSATFEVTSNGSTVTGATLASTATSGSDDTINGDFSSGVVLGVRNAAGGNATSNVLGTVTVRWRV